MGIFVRVLALVGLCLAIAAKVARIRGGPQWLDWGIALSAACLLLWLGWLAYEKRAGKAQ